jgi:hypothetical protein
MALIRPLFVLLGISLSVGAARADITVNFSDLNPGTNSFYNGSNGTGGFTSAGTFFNNSYNTTFGSWSGWSYSTVNNTTTGEFTNQYAAITGTAPPGHGNTTGVYAVAYNFNPGDAYINLPGGASPSSMLVTNTTYTYLSLLNGNQFESKLQPNGYFELKIFGYSGLGATGSKLGEVDFYLGDYRNGKTLLVNTWSSVDLSSLAGARSIGFALAASADQYTDFGSGPSLDTPAYFAMDDLVLRSASVPEPASLSLMAVGVVGIALTIRRVRPARRP